MISSTFECYTILIIRHAEQFYDRSLEPAPVDTSSSDSSGDDNDEYQRKKKAAYHQGDHRS